MLRFKITLIANFVKRHVIVVFPIRLYLKLQGFSVRSTGLPRGMGHSVISTETPSIIYRRVKSRQPEYLNAIQVFM